MTRELLDAESITAALSELPGWRAEGASLKKEFAFSDYLKGAKFVQYAAENAEGMDHHPDLLLRWRKVEVTLSTHSAGGITALDVELARRIEDLEV